MVKLPDQEKANSQQIKKAVINEIRGIIAEKEQGRVTVAKKLVNITNSSQKTIYRKLRGDHSFTVEEIIKVLEYYNLDCFKLNYGNNNSLTISTKN